MEAREQFAELVTRPEPPLDEGAVLIAAGPNPALDVGAQLERLDDLASGCPEPTLDGLRRHLFDDLGFSGDSENFGDPANSYLDAVLDRRLGLPITLAVVAIEVGRRIGVGLGGVAMPGHFLVRSLDDGSVFIDAFRGGVVIDEERCRALYSAMRAEPWDPGFLDVVDARTILWRMLTNLRVGFVAAGDMASLRWVLEYQVSFPDRPPEERRMVAAMLGSVGDIAGGAAALDEAADDLAPDAAEAARAQARVLRARMN